MRFVGRSVRLLALASAIVPLLASPPPGDAAETGRLFVVVRVADNSLAEVPARASIVTPEGKLVDYAEELLTRAPNVQSFLLEGLAEGIYDVRVEGAGLVTEVKKGVPIFAGRDEKVTVVVRPGQGVRIVEYAVAGLSREEVAARLGRLEAETASLRADLEALRSPR